MGNDFCCAPENETKQKTKVRAIRNDGIAAPKTQPFKQTSTSESSKAINIETPVLESPRSPKRSIGFGSYLMLKQVEFSQIKVMQLGQQQRCSQRKIFIEYLQRLQKQIQKIKKQNDNELYRNFLNRNQKLNIDEKRFIQHATKCPVCYQLYENLKNVEAQQNNKINLPEIGMRKSLRDSLLQFFKLEKAKNSQQCKYHILQNDEEVTKVRKKYPNSNIYQSKRLRFRKTSTFEPQIHQLEQSKQSMDSR